MTTIADLQSERERLRADQARQDYESAWAATVGQDDLLAAGLAVRRVLLDALDAAADELVDAIRGEDDETRVHYLMSECGYRLLDRTGLDAEIAAAALPLVGQRFKAGIKPRELLTVSQWADKYRYLASGTNMPGPWRTEATPYLREIMDCLSEHSPVRTVTFMKPSGVGGTEVLYNWIGYVMHWLRNKDMLQVVPTIELRDRSFNPRLNKMLSETPVLAEMASSAMRSKVNRADLLEHGPARLIKAGANSPDSLRSDHVPYVAKDEVDAFPWDVGGEGDPDVLIENRQRTYSRAKTYEASTPTREGGSRIARNYDRSDKRRYFVPCPHCGELQHLEWGGKEREWGLKFRRKPQAADDQGPEQVEAAWYVCKHSGCIIEEGHKGDMLAAGRWIAERPHIKQHRGYHLNALYAPTGLGLTWRQIAQRWINAQGDSASLKGFYNTDLGLVFREEGDSIEDVSLLSRRETYTLADLRAAGRIALLVAGVDVQKDRIEASVAAYGPGEECWLLDHVIVAGDTENNDTWDELADLLADAGVQIAAIDSGYRPNMVYAFCKKHPWAYATKGVEGMSRSLVEDEKRRRQRLRARRKKGHPVEPIGVDSGKSLLYARLRKMPPETEGPCPGYVHFPLDDAFDDEYFAQLAAEKLEVRYKGYRPVYEWKKLRPRNEALDCLLLCLVAVRLSGSKLEPKKPDQPAPQRAAPRRIGRVGGFQQR